MRIGTAQDPVLQMLEIGILIQLGEKNADKNTTRGKRLETHFRLKNIWVLYIAHMNMFFEKLVDIEIYLISVFVYSTQM